MTFTLRPLTPADQPFLWEMLYHAIYVPPGEPPPPRHIIYRPVLARYAQGWGRPGDLGFIAVSEDENRPVGAAWLRLWSGDERGYGYVNDETPELSIAVLPDCRGRGIGTQLLTRVLAEAQLRYPAVSLSVAADNLARRLYKRLGFVAIVEEGESLIMVIRLTR